MTQRRKLHSAGLALVTVASWMCAGLAQEPPVPAAPPADRMSVAPKLSESDEIEGLFKELAKPDQPEWERIETEIARLWSRSGSESMDLLLKRGNDAVAAGNLPEAVEHYSALIDHAPDFAEGWNARATAWYEMGEYSLSIADIEHVLALNSRHFGALQGLAVMLEEMGEPELALKALRLVQTINPNRPNVNDAVKRLQRATGEAEL